MYVRSLQLVGFKSFADRTRLEFEPGVTVVVGPNGSGKSNLVDAIAWVMGTQSTRALRTRSMDDVIFAGTATRPALGRAEVTLVLDNTDRTMPLDLDEVAISRKLTRDGTSTYAINGVECRLLDIQELMSDSGIGRQQHLIIGQGRIDELLNARPEDHRAVIEEAAGILKHRLRKERAERRLERTDADLLRLQDIVRELKRQMRPLKRQAEFAERHEQIVSEVKALRLYLAGEQLRGVRGAIASTTDEQNEWQAKLTAARRDADVLEAELPSLADAAGAAGRALDRDTAAAARHETTVERLRRLGQVAHERLRAAKARLEDAGVRRRDLEEEASRLEEALGSGGAEAAAAQRDLAQADQELQRLEYEVRSLADQESLPVEGALAVVRGELRSLESTLERDGKEGRDLGRRLEVLHARVTEETVEIDRVQAELLAADAAASTAQTAYEQAKRTREQRQAEWEDRQTRLEEARLVLTAAEARLAAFEDAAGGDPEVRARALAVPGVVGTLTAALDVPDEWAKAVDAALGVWAGGLVTTDASSLEAAVAAIKREGLGGVALLHADGRSRGSTVEVAERLGLMRLVDVLGPGHDRLLAEGLLGDVLIVEGWSTGMRVAGDGLRAVTPEGDVFAAGKVYLAHPDGATPAMIERAAAQVEAAAEELAKAESLAVVSRRAFDAARDAERQALEALEQIEVDLAGRAEALRLREQARHSAEQEIERLQERRDAVMESAGQAERQLERLRARLEALEGEEAERQRAWEDLAARRAEVEQRRRAAGERRQAAAEALGAILERRRMLEERLRAVRGELQDLTDRPVDPRAVARLEAVEAASAQAVTMVRGHIEVLRERQRRLRTEAGEAGQRLAEARARLEELRRAADAARDAASTAQIALVELRAKEEAVLEALRRDADAGPDEALAAPRPDVEGDLDELLGRRVAELRRMGPVNPLAAAEYRELSERYEFLQAQLHDLESSRNDLRRVITALDGQIADEFMAAFSEVAGHYESFFGMLFPGGRGRVRLTEPDDPLRSGVEVEARPLGKKVSRLSLLSGGERSLAALAFLFAVFKARPGPFYVLDEVEAALDDANLRRFLRMVEQFRVSAQLLIVTHQQQTMEVADLLYGVTLESGGSSQVVSRRIRERTLL